MFNLRNYWHSMKIKNLSKRKFYKKKLGKETIHWEGKYVCDCRVRNYRIWLGMKRYGVDECQAM